ncbi:RNA-binding protein [Candidatus Dojkabacteria bacterium]|nr:RNA-binding protein [Candidatus Dojkabacteria bacterium]
MKNRLFIGSLAWGTTEDSLKAFFEEVGEVVDVKIITDKFSGRSKGFGFVTMATDELAEKAVAELDGKELDGRAIKVALAKPREDREER